jgi:hypothetical protein
MVPKKRDLLKRTARDRIDASTAQGMDFIDWRYFTISLYTESPHPARLMLLKRKSGECSPYE